MQESVLTCLTIADLVDGEEFEMEKGVPKGEFSDVLERSVAKAVSQLYESDPENLKREADTPWGKWKLGDIFHHFVHNLMYNCGRMIYLQSLLGIGAPKLRPESVN